MPSFPAFLHLHHFRFISFHLEPNPNLMSTSISLLFVVFYVHKRQTTTYFRWTYGCMYMLCTHTYHWMKRFQSNLSLFALPSFIHIGEGIGKKIQLTIKSDLYIIFTCLISFNTFPMFWGKSPLSLLTFDSDQNLDDRFCFFVLGKWFFVNKLP